MINFKYDKSFFYLDFDIYYKNTKRTMRMDIIQNIIRKLMNALDYYHETEDINDLISDIKDIVNGLLVGNIS